LLLGFLCRLVFFAVELAGGLIGMEIGLMLPSGMNPNTGEQSSAPAAVLYYLAIMLWLGLDLHHWVLAAFQRTYELLPVGQARLSAGAVEMVVGQSVHLFGVALLITAPVLAVTFIISLVFAVLGRAVPQMNVFAESFALRILAGLSVMGSDVPVDGSAHHQLPEPAAGGHPGSGPAAGAPPMSEHQGEKDRATDAAAAREGAGEGTDPEERGDSDGVRARGRIDRADADRTGGLALFRGTFVSVLAHLHELPLSLNSSRGQLLTALVALGQCVGPVFFATVAAALVAGGFQTRFRTASEALEANWNRVNALEGAKRLLTFRQAIPAGISLLKLTVIIALTYGVVREILFDPIFYSGVTLERIAGFMAGAGVKIVVRVLFALALVAALDYAYQAWRTQRDLMMTRQEVKDEMKSSEGDPHVKARLKARRRQVSLRKMLLEVPRADVVVTNPVRLAVALRYDRRTMKAPRIVAKGSRLNAQRIRQLARQHGVPVIENRPLARLMFKHGRVGGEVPAQLYAAVAEVLAWVYRVNAYRYHKEGTSIR
jgi:flagellar biosynthesis protein FliR/FlhB